MMKIKNVAVIGAGAIGSAYAALFCEAPGFDVKLVARGERYQRLKRRGVTVNGKPYPLPVVEPDDGSTPQPDLMIVALKHHHLAEAVEDINRAVGDDTVIMSIMNGLESEKIIGSVCGMEKIVPAIVVGIDAVNEDGAFTFTTPGKLIFGDDPAQADSIRLERLREAFNRASIPNEISADIWRTIWWKFMINVGINQASAVLKAPYGVFQTIPEAGELVTALMEEVIPLAQRSHIDLSARVIDEWGEIQPTLSPTGKTSMLQDVEAGRKTEVDIFAGKVVALGKKYNLPTPVNKTVLQIIQVFEKRG